MKFEEPEGFVIFSVYKLQNITKNSSWIHYIRFRFHKTLKQSFLCQVRFWKPESKKICTQWWKTIMQKEMENAITVAILRRHAAVLVWCYEHWAKTFERVKYEDEVKTKRWKVLSYGVGFVVKERKSIKIFWSCFPLNYKFGSTLNSVKVESFPILHENSPMIRNHMITKSNSVR